MTSYLGPDNPTPFCISSALKERLIPLEKAKDNLDEIFSYDDKYYAKVCRLLWVHGEINIDDRICIVTSMKSKLSAELEKRLDLIYPVVKVVPKKILFETISDGSREIVVGNLPIGAEDYFSQNNEKGQSFDKIIISDGLELFDDRFSILTNMKNRLVDKMSNIIIMHRTADILTLPFYYEIIQNFSQCQVNTENILSELFHLNLIVGWVIYSLPIHLSRNKWLNQLYNNFPPIVEALPNTDVYGGLRHLIDTSFKYSEQQVVIKDTFVLLVANNNTEEFFGQIPYQMKSNLDDVVTRQQDSNTESDNCCSLLRLKLTEDILKRLPKNWMSTAPKYKDELAKFPEEWWGTIPNANLGDLDRCRINKYLK